MFRISLRINPIVVILSLLIGFQIYGIAGALLALPVAAVIRETVLYLRRHLVLEPWVTTTAAGPGAGLEAGGPSGAHRAPARRRPPGPGGAAPDEPPADPDLTTELVRTRAGRDG